MLEAEHGELRQRFRLIGTIHLVYHQQAGLAEPSDLVGDGFVGAGQPIPGIHQKQNTIRFFQRLIRLRFQRIGNCAWIAKQAAGVHQGERQSVDGRATIATISRQARHIRHQRIPTAGQPVEKG